VPDFAVRAKSGTLLPYRRAHMEELLQRIENHGLALIALILVIYWLKPKVDDMWSTIMDMAKTKREKDSEDRNTRKFPDTVIDTMELDAKIMNVLRQIQGEFKADRVYIFSFHNGGKNILGMDFAKVSCTHEIVALGIQPMQRWLQNMPVTLVHAFARLILTGVGVICPSIEQCFKDTDSSTYETLRAQGIKSCYCCGLMSDGGLPIGFLGIDYVDDYEKLEPSAIDKLKTFTERVATLFCLAGHFACSQDSIYGEKKE